MPVEIALPFRVAPNGSIASTSDPNQQIRNHVMSLINTEPYERSVLIDYGVPLMEDLFEDDDEGLATMLAEDIRGRMSKWEPGVAFQSIDRVPGPSGDGLTSVDVRYLRVDAPDSTFSQTGYNTAVIRVGGHVDEVVRG